MDDWILPTLERERLSRTLAGLGSPMPSDLALGLFGLRGAALIVLKEYFANRDCVF